MKIIFNFLQIKKLFSYEFTNRQKTLSSLTPSKSNNNFKSSYLKPH